MLRISCALAVLGVAACRSPSSGDRPPDANVMQAGHAPTPYTAEQIRVACRGAELVMETTTGGRAVRSLTRFPAGRDTETEAEIEMVTLAADGSPGATRRVRARWAELQGHASFPAACTTITAESCTTPAGTFESWRYDVHEGGEAASRRRYWFAKDLPGPPVRMEVEAGGRLQTAMVLVERRRGG